MSAKRKSDPAPAETSVPEQVANPEENSQGDSTAKPSEETSQAQNIDNEEGADSKARQRRERFKALQARAVSVP